jgi:hypothetical protein
MVNALKIALGLIALEVAFISADHGTEHQKHVYALVLAAVYVAGVALVAGAVKSRRKAGQRQQPSGWTYR